MIEEPIWRPVGSSEMMVPERVTGGSPGWRILVSMMASVGFAVMRWPATVKMEARDGGGVLSGMIEEHISRPDELRDKTVPEMVMAGLPIRRVDDPMTASEGLAAKNRLPTLKVDDDALTRGMAAVVPSTIMPLAPGSIEIVLPAMTTADPPALMVAEPILINRLSLGIASIRRGGAG